MSRPHARSSSQVQLLAKLKRLRAAQFENLVFDLAQRLGLENCVWRTPGSDAGRDIEAQYSFLDVSGHVQTQKWYIECKRYSHSINWPIIWEKISYAETQGADVLLVATTAPCSTQAIDQIEKWNLRKRGLVVRTWSVHALLHLLLSNPDILHRYGLIPGSEEVSRQAIYPLSLLCLKHVQLAEAAMAFNGVSNRSLEAAAALADLVNKRLAKNALLQVSPVRETDIYNWVSIGELRDVRGFDRYGLRALLSNLRCFTKENDLTISATSTGVTMKLPKALTELQTKELKTIAEWTGGEFLVLNRTMSLNRRKRK